MRLAISLATRGRPEILRRTIETTLPNIHDPNTTIFVAVDHDDEPTCKLAQSSGLPVTFSIAEREDSLGEKYNRILQHDSEADVYLAMVDYSPHITPGFDLKIIEAAIMLTALMAATDLRVRLGST